MFIRVVDCVGDRYDKRGRESGSGSFKFGELRSFFLAVAGSYCGAGQVLINSE